MPVVMKMPTILEDETVFIRHAGELRFPDNPLKGHRGDYTE